MLVMWMWMDPSFVMLMPMWLAGTVLCFADPAQHCAALRNRLRTFARSLARAHAQTHTCTHTGTRTRTDTRPHTHGATRLALAARTDALSANSSELHWTERSTGRWFSLRRTVSLMIGTFSPNLWRSYCR